MISLLPRSGLPSSAPSRNNHDAYAYTIAVRHEQRVRRAHLCLAPRSRWLPVPPRRSAPFSGRLCREPSPRSIHRLDRNARSVFLNCAHISHDGSHYTFMDVDGCVCIAMNSRGARELATVICRRVSRFPASAAFSRGRRRRRRRHRHPLGRDLARMFCPLHVQASAPSADYKMANTPGVVYLTAPSRAG